MKTYVFVAIYVVAIYDSGNNVMETLQMTQNWLGSVFVAHKSLVVVEIRCLPRTHKEAFRSSMRLIEEVGSNSGRVVACNFHPFRPSACMWK